MCPVVCLPHCPCPRMEMTTQGGDSGPQVGGSDSTVFSGHHLRLGAGGEDFAGGTPACNPCHVVQLAPFPSKKKLLFRSIFMSLGISCLWQGWLRNIRSLSDSIKAWKTACPPLDLRVTETWCRAGAGKLRPHHQGTFSYKLMQAATGWYSRHWDRVWQTMERKKKGRKLSCQCRGSEFRNQHESTANNCFFGSVAVQIPNTNSVHFDLQLIFFLNETGNQKDKTLSTADKSNMLKRAIRLK